MSQLFTNCTVTKSTMLEARRIKPIWERVAAKIQKEIDYAADHGRGETIVNTDCFALTPAVRKMISDQLTEAGYWHRWRDTGSDNERVHICWEDGEVHN